MRYIKKKSFVAVILMAPPAAFAEAAGTLVEPATLQILQILLALIWLLMIVVKISSTRKKVRSGVMSPTDAASQGNTYLVIVTVVFGMLFTASLFIEQLRAYLV